MKLILFDIDGTLLDCGRQVRPLLAGALETVYGTAGEIGLYDFAGKPDPRIVLDLMTGAGLERDAILERLPRLQALYLEALESGLRVERMRLLPGVREVLDRLAGQSSVTLGLVTGNWEAGARIKLGRAGATTVSFKGGRLAVTPIDLDAATARRLREALPGANYEAGRSQLSLRVPDDPAQRFPAVVRAADALLSVQSAA